MKFRHSDTPDVRKVSIVLQLTLEEKAYISDFAAKVGKTPTQFVLGVLGSELDRMERAIADGVPW